jgi:hypothetical protein
MKRSTPRVEDKSTTVRSSTDVIKSESPKDEAPFVAQMDSSHFNSSGLPVEHASEATTTFTDEGAHSITDMSSKVTKDELEVKLESIKDFLGKPYLVSSAGTTWDTSGLVDTNLFTFSPQDYVTPVGILPTGGKNDLWYSKVQGFNLIRATVVVRVMINANPFQAGRLMLHFLPYVPEIADYTTNYEKMYNANLAVKTQHPNVEIDCRDSVGLLRIPYVAPTNWQTIESGQSNGWGTFYLDILSALKTGASGETKVDYSVYLWFEDVELSAPFVPQGIQLTTLNPQSGRVVHRPKKARQAKVKVRTVMVNNPLYNEFKPQAGKARSVRGRAAVAQDEAINMTSTPIATALSHVSKAASSFASIPMLASVAKPASWVLDAASGVASIFGWAKPLHNERPIVDSRQYNRYAATSDGMDASMPLALRSDNALTVSDGYSIRSEDEMSFEFLKKVPAYTGYFTWSATDIVGTQLDSIGAVGPQLLCVSQYQTQGGKQITFQTGPPIFYLSSLFTQWRGSIKIILKIVKTDFHTGRIQIVWSPTTGAVAANTLTKSNFALREIIDLRETSEIELNLPYLLAKDWLSTAQTSGTFTVTVLNELRAPETADQSVDIMIFACGGDDFEFAAPGAGGIVSGAYQSEAFVPQSGLPTTIREGVGDTRIQRLDTSPSEKCVGEVFTSVKQLISRYGQIWTISTIPSNNALLYWPWQWSTSIQNSSTGVIEGNTTGGDTISYLAHMYALYRGSMRVMVDTTKEDVASFGGRNSTVEACINPAWFYTAGRLVLDAGYGTAGADAPLANLRTYGNTNNSTRPGAAGTAISDSQVGMCAFQIPYYSNTKCSMVMPMTVSTVPNTVNSAWRANNQPTSVLSLNCPAGFTKSSLYRSCGEDFTFSYFIGCPPIVHAST